MLGWGHKANVTGISERQQHSLAGEAIHLGPLSSLMCAIFYQPSAPWWPGGSGATVPAASLPAASSVSDATVAPPRKKRRTGGLKVCRSLG